MARKSGAGWLVLAALLVGAYYVAPQSTTNVLTNLAFWKSTSDAERVNEMFDQTCSNDPDSVFDKPNLHCERIPATITTTTTAPQ